ncbi:MAG: hypothetical protein K2K55_02645 [Duncaniella sp.]|nr:hypothetical protein [Duncaniella sp.]
MTPGDWEIGQKDLTRQKALSAFETMRQLLASSGMPQMSLEEINAEKRQQEKRERTLLLTFSIPLTIYLLPHVSIQMDEMDKGIVKFFL